MKEKRGRKGYKKALVELPVDDGGGLPDRAPVVKVVIGGDFTIFARKEIVRVRVGLVVIETGIYEESLRQ